MRRSICAPTTASARLGNRSAATSTSTMPEDPTPPLTGEPPIKLTSTRCSSARQPNPGRGSTYRRGDSVQITAATSDRDVPLRPKVFEVLRYLVENADRL